MCAHPEVPVFDGRAVPSSEPVRCATCGGELELICSSNRCPAPLGPNNQVRGRGIPRSGKRHYRPKPCVRCLRMFDPTGPRSIACSRADCSDVAHALSPADSEVSAP